MAQKMDPVLPLLSIWGYRAIILGSFGGPGTSLAIPSQSKGLAYEKFPKATIFRGMSLPLNCFREASVKTDLLCQPIAPALHRWGLLAKISPVLLRPTDLWLM